MANMKRFFDSVNTFHEEPIPDKIQMASSSSSAALHTSSADKPGLWLNNPSRPYILGRQSSEIIDLTESKYSDDDFFYGLWN